MYNKIFAKILDSSIWLESDTTRIIWFMFIAVMDEDGFCSFASPANVAHRARVSLEAATEALRTLEAADPNSADTENDGRRIERTAGGWLVMNARKYREIVTREESKRLQRDRSKRYRTSQRDASRAVTERHGESVTSNTNGAEKSPLISPNELDQVIAAANRHAASRPVTPTNANEREANATVTQSETETDTEKEAEVQTKSEVQRENRAPRLIEFDSVTQHLKAAAYAHLAEHPACADSDLAEAVKAAAATLHVFDYTGRKVTAIVNHCRGYLASREREAVATA